MFVTSSLLTSDLGLDQYQFTTFLRPNGRFLQLNVEPFRVAHVAGLAGSHYAGRLEIVEAKGIPGAAVLFMLLTFDNRVSSSPLVERVWRCRSHGSGSFLSLPEGNLELVVTRLPSLVMVTLRGPVLRAAVMECPPNGEWLAIRFRIGTYVPRLLPAELSRHEHVELPVLPDGRFWFGGLSWEIPTWANAEDFVARLAQAGVITRSHAADAAVVGDAAWMSKRSVERHVARATGMNLGTLQQILRVRHAIGLLVGGHSILDATFEAGYYDQAHLTRSMKQLIGITPGELVKDRPELSFSYESGAACA